jgi:opacity protein-like surface antigen
MRRKTMNKYVRAQIAAALLAATAAPAMAADVIPYVEGFGGYSIGSQSGGNGDIVNGSGFGGDFGSSSNFGGGIGIKIPVDNAAFRFDVTGNWNPSLGGDNHGGTLSDGTPVNAKVKLSAVSYLATAYMDVDFGLPVVPFVGFGLGGTHKKIGTVVFSNPAGAFATVNGNDKEGLAWTATAGATYSLMKNIEIDLDYRYINAGKVNSGATFTDLTNGVSQQLDSQISSHLQIHQFGATLRYLF